MLTVRGEPFFLNFCLRFRVSGSRGLGSQALGV